MGKRILMTCEQCERPFWAQRRSARFCSEACRKRRSRGTPPVPYWSGGRAPDHLEQLAVLVAQEAPDIWRKLEAIQKAYGNRAVRATLEVLHMGVQDWSENPDRDRPKSPETAPK